MEFQLIPGSYWIEIKSSHVCYHGTNGLNFAYVVRLSIPL